MSSNPKAYVCFVLDFYQPTTQTTNVAKKIVEEAYFPILRLINTSDHGRFTISITQSLFQVLHRIGYEEEVRQLLRQALDNERLDLAHSGAYHSVLPLLPIDEVRRQIELDLAFKKEQLAIDSRAGFFLPELCYDDKLLPLIQEMGFKWTLVDDQLAGLYGITVPTSNIYHVNGLSVFMRSSLWSNALTSKHWSGLAFVRHLERHAEQLGRDSYTIVSLSAETFGHHMPWYHETFLKDMLFAATNSVSVELCAVSDLLNKHKIRQTGTPVREAGKTGRFTCTWFPPSSWATSADDDRRGDSYPHWRSRGNPIHDYLWQLTELILDSCRGMDFGEPRNAALRNLLDQSFYSCQYYWASIWFWNPELVYLGIDLQMRALYKCARLTGNLDALAQGERIYRNLMRNIHVRQVEEKGKRRS